MGLLLLLILVVVEIVGVVVGLLLVIHVRSKRYLFCFDFCEYLNGMEVGDPS